MNFNQKEQYIISGLLLILVLLGGIFIYQHGKAVEVEPVLTEDSGQKQLENSLLIVHVCGEVKHPGVYQLAGGKRIIDAIEAAGGATEQGDLDKLNLAAVLEDGQKVYLPSSVSVAPSQISSNPVASQKATADNVSLVNINSADQQTLESLPGIGPALAKRIIDYRSQQGLFGSVEDLRKVSGIGEKKFEQLKDQVTIN